MAAVDQIIEFAAGPPELAAATRQNVERHLRDTLGCGIGGSTAPGAQGVRQSMMQAGALAAGSAGAPVMGTRLRLPAPGAACANAFQIHCLEWDAVHEPAVVHALSVVTGTLLALTDPHKADDSAVRARFASALAIGVDVASGLGLACISGLRFFRPANAGLMGASLAAAHFLGMTKREMYDVFGLAYSQAHGTMQAHVEGSIALPLQIALSARAAVTAVDLVRNGLTGPHDVLEGPFGYYALFEDEADLTRYTRDLGTRWRIDEISTKPFPTGRASHGILSTLQRMQREDGFAAGAVERITALVPPLCHRLVGRAHRSDMTPAYARLCVRFLAALMLTDGRIDPRRCTPESFADGQLRALSDRVDVVVDGNSDPNALSPQQIIVELRDGRRLDWTVPATLGSPAAPMTAEEYDDKLAMCLELANTPLSAAQAERLREDPVAFALGKA